MELKSSIQASTYIIQAQEEEIKRISNELHEGISQHLYSVNTGLEFLHSALENPDLKSYVKELAAQLNRTIQEVRLLSVELYPSSLSTLGLVAAMKSYLKQFTSTFGVIIHIDTIGHEQFLSESNQLAVFRACQEALINIAKYADTSEASLRFIWKDNILKIEIEDDGKGFHLKEILGNTRCKGIAAMKQRMAMAGGDCQISSEEGKGTKVSLSLPFQR
ncbi:sensor histidine kinase [Aquibacillus albus]|uniref:histidine kinase n=1 Tax=Aquibacillus albus TaxID=1168171 RepID=A0ABS2MYJ5_9BACI|nr:ATP-binding protein [Aquibacillus albus]MBM7570957.1 two-component system sensor histidine kinase NreB [Aquibacillus albus]